MSKSQSHGGTYRGHRIRLTLTDGERVDGRFESSTKKFIIVKQGCDLRKVMRRNVRTFSVGHIGFVA